MKFRVWDKDRGFYIEQSMNDLLNGIGDDCPDWETSMFANAVLQEGGTPELVQEVIGKINPPAGPPRSFAPSRDPVR